VTFRGSLSHGVAFAAALTIGLSACSGSTAPITLVGASGGSTGTKPAPSAQAPAPTAAPAPAAKDGSTVTIAFTGDVLLHAGVTDQAAKDGAANPGAASHGLDYRPLLAGAKPFAQSADLAICNLETPIAPPGGPYTTYPVFSVPPEILPALVDTGFDACTTASNHTVDKGMPGIQRTLDAMDAAGLKHAGSNRSAQEQSGTTMLDAHGVKVALLAYAYGLNGFQLPADKKWAVDMIDTATILADARAARAAGAAIVLVALHTGTEYQVLPTAQQREVATALAASPDIDLIYGHHAHVVQPFDKIGNTWVAYGLGNMIAHQHRLPKLTMAQHEVMAQFTFTSGTDGRWSVSRAEARPAVMSNLDEPLRYLDLATLLADPTVSEARKAAYRPFYDRAVASLTKLGADTKGLVIAGR
jgi:poly-gamma-glutamate synthesis protein (capsule biosynthesis protein)